MATRQLMGFLPGTPNRTTAIRAGDVGLVQGTVHAQEGLKSDQEVLGYVDKTIQVEIEGVANLRGFSGTPSRVYLAYGSTPGDEVKGVYRRVTGEASGAFVDNGTSIIVPSGGNGSTAWLFDGLVGGGGGAGDSAYLYIAWASNDAGADFDTTFNPVLEYIAVKSTTSPIVSPVAGDFAGLWAKYKGTNGTNGTNGTPGIDGIDGIDGDDGTPGTNGTNAYLYLAYASDDTGTGFTTTFNPALDFIAIKNTTSPMGSPSAGDFAGLWKNYKGATGATGGGGGGGLPSPGTAGNVLTSDGTEWTSAAPVPGTPGEDGIDGTDGASAFVYIAWASAADGTGFTTTFNPALKYIAIKSTTAEIVTPVVGDFTGLFTKYIGDDGGGGGGGGASIHEGETAPDPLVFPLWFNPATLVMAYYYDDGSSAQWLSIGIGPRGIAGTNGTNGTNGVDGDDGAPGPTIYPAAGISVSTGTAWDSSKTVPAGDLVGTTATQTLSAKTFTSPSLNNYTSPPFTITDGAAVVLDPNNGENQIWNLGATRTPDQANWASGQGFALIVTDGTDYTINWGTLSPTWLDGSAPTLATTGVTVIVLFKIGTTIYGTKAGV